LTYSYDANNELTGASGTLNGSNYSVSYSYDANGNRTMSGYQTGTGNELLSDGTYNYTYDKDGNMTSQTNIATGYVTYYSWDYRNRLIEVKQEDNHGNVLNDEKFTYDVNNNRIAVSLNGTTQLYTVYDGANPYMDFNGSGTLTQRYLTNPKVLSQFYGQVNASGTVQWFLTDNINSIRQVVGTSGSVLNEITYDPYGNILNQTNAAYAPRMLYAGGGYDPLTGNYQFKARNYSPADGRFVSQDLLGFKAGDTDLYRYVGNRPTNLVDPSGMWWSWRGCVGGAISGGILGVTAGFLFGWFGLLAAPILPRHVRSSHIHVGSILD
jgi:RHS repeat-associated protein